MPGKIVFIEPPRHPGCGSCGQWRREIGHALGFCRKDPLAPQRDDEGRLIRANHRRSDEQYACHEPRLGRAA